MAIRWRQAKGSQNGIPHHHRFNLITIQPDDFRRFAKNKTAAKKAAINQNSLDHLTLTHGYSKTYIRRKYKRKQTCYAGMSSGLPDGQGQQVHHPETGKIYTAPIPDEQ